MKNLTYALLLCSLVTRAPILARSKVRTKKVIETYHTRCTTLEAGPVTIFIHGTVFPVALRVFHHDDTRRGLYRYKDALNVPKGKATRRRERLGEVLHTASPKEFPLSSYYKFYWSGKLSFSARLQAAEELYSFIEKHTGPITLIGHSHGCNVALLLSQIASQKKSPLSIDRLVLLAAPVQAPTLPLVSSPFFKRVYSLYSTADLPQVADPQGLYAECKDTAKDGAVPFFSGRIFPPSPNLVQARLLIGRRSPKHIDFIRINFFKQIPELLRQLDYAQANGKNHILIDIPACGNAPHQLDFTLATLPYKPRKIGQCTCTAPHRRA